MQFPVSGYGPPDGSARRPAPSRVLDLYDPLPRLRGRAEPDRRIQLCLPPLRGYVPCQPRLPGPHAGSHDRRTCKRMRARAGACASADWAAAARPGRRGWTGRCGARTSRSRGTSSPSSRSSAVWTSRSMPSWTMAKATSGWMPTMTVSAPRRRAMWARSRKRLRAERVEDVERGDVDDDPPRPVLADLVDEVLLEPHQLGVVERGVDRGDQEVPLAQDRDEHRHVVPIRSARRRCGSPGSRAGARPPRSRLAGRRSCSSCSGRPRW